MARRATLAKLQEKRAALDARIRRHETKLKGEERQRDTRRKILAGAAILDEAAQREDLAVMLNALLHRFLSKPRDRALFDLPPLPASLPPASIRGGSDKTTVPETTDTP